MTLIDNVRTILRRAGASARYAESADGRAAIVCILAVCANSDGGISPEENLRMVQLLRRRFSLQPGEALELVTRFADQRGDDAEFQRLLGVVRDEFSQSDKEDLLLMVISVIAADREKSAAEMQWLDSLVEALGVPDESLEAAYARYFDQN